LRDASYRGAGGLGHGVGYVYPHDLSTGVAAQEYAPEPVRGRQYYEPSDHGAEARWRAILARLRVDLVGDLGAPDNTDPDDAGPVSKS
jgi:putative ATPase